MGDMLEEKLFPPLGKKMLDSSLRHSTTKGLLQVPRKGVQNSPSFEDLVEVNRHHSDSSDSSSSGGEEESAVAEAVARDQQRKRKVHKASLPAQAGTKNYALRNVMNASIRPVSSDPNMASSSRPSVTIRVRRPSNDVRETETQPFDGESFDKQTQQYNQADVDGTDANHPVANSQSQVRKRKRPILLNMHEDVKFDDSSPPKELDQCLVDQSTGEDLSAATASWIVTINSK